MEKDRLIIAGVDGSKTGIRALRWALDESARTERKVHAIVAFRPEVDMSIRGAQRPSEARKRAEAVMEEVKAAVEAENNDASLVSWSLVEGRPSKVLVDAAKASDLLVVGSHGQGRVREKVLGSVSTECVRAAHCPVLVVPAEG